MCSCQLTASVALYWHEHVQNNKQTNMERLSAEKRKLLLLFLESSSESSDSDDDFEELVNVLLREDKKPNLDQFKSRARSLTETEFKMKYRVSKATYDVLVRDFKNSKLSRENSGNPACRMNSAENHILSFLWYAGTHDCLKNVADRFGIGQATLFRQMQRVSSFLLEVAPKYLAFPRTYEEQAKISFGFENVNGFPGVLGCIGSCKISIRNPGGNPVPRSVQTKKKSVSVQAVCSSDQMFLDVLTGSHGEPPLVDSVAFNQTDIPEICSNEYQLIGGVTYPLRSWLLTPYIASPNLTPKQQSFNRMLREMNSAVGHAFQSLRRRFKRLEYLEFRTAERASQFVRICCILHNICIRVENGVHLPLELSDDVASLEANDAPDESVLSKQNNGILDALAETKRNQLCDSLM